MLYSQDSNSEKRQDEDLSDLDCSELSSSLANTGYPPSSDTSSSINTNQSLSLTCGLNRFDQLMLKYQIQKRYGECLDFLEDYEIIIVCDDSGSMKTINDQTNKTRWDELCYIVKIILEIGIIFDSTGVDIYFLNRGSFRNVKTLQRVDQMFSLRPRGYTPLVPILKHIFKSPFTRRGNDKKVLVFVATDGAPTDETGNVNIDELEHLMNEERNVHTTHVMFLICTDDKYSVDYLSDWDQKMVNVDVTNDYQTEKDKIRSLRGDAYPFSTGDYICKALLGAIDPSFDSLHEPNLVSCTTDDKHDPSHEKIDIQPTVIFNNDLIGVSLESSKDYIASSENNICDNICFVSKPISNNVCNILIVCLKIDCSLIPSDSKYSIESFNDECICIVRLLSMMNKRVYFIVSNSVDEYIIPFIYQHRCVEQIYIHCPDENQRNPLWISHFEIIRGCWTDNDTLFMTVYNDIQSNLLGSSLWSNVELIEKCHTQTLISSSEESVISLDVLNMEKSSNSNKEIHIVVLHCGNDTLFDAKSQRFQLFQFSDVIQCVKHLERIDIQSVFFIVSGEIKSIIDDIKAVTMLKQVYAIYFFVPIINAQELDETILIYKNIGRLFDNLEFLLNCLSADIQFYFELSSYSPISSVFPSRNNTKVTSKMDFIESREKFYAFQLFVNHFRESPTSNYRNQNLYDRCLTLAENKLDGEHALTILKTNQNQIFDWFVNVPFLSVVINSLLEEKLPRNLLDIQKILGAIDQHFIETTPTTSSSIVYRVQFLRREDLEIIKTNINELITFHTYIIATKDLLTARTIARQAADRGLLIIILQISVPSQTHLLQLHNNRLMFQFGTNFRIRSINLSPDDVWYAQLKVADSDFKSLEERLQLQMGEQLTWLTLGNYLCALNHFDDAKIYLNYLRNALPKDSKALPSIYNNMGLIYAELDDHKQSLRCYNTAIHLLEKISSNKDHTSKQNSFETLSQSAKMKIVEECCRLYDKISDVHSQQSQHEEVLECYRKALELATDPLIRLQYDRKIKDILSSKHQGNLWYSDDTVGKLETRFDDSTLCSDQNLLCIWYHDDDLSKNIQSEMKNRLNRSFTYIRIFNDPCQFAQYLVGPLLVSQIFFIITSQFAECLRFLATNHSPNGKVYQFRPNISPANNSLNEFDKLFMQISDDINTYLNNNRPSSTGDTTSVSGRELRVYPPWNIWNSKRTENSFEYCRNESPKFFLFQALSRILVKMEYDYDQSFTDMVEACRLHYINDSTERQKIDEVEKQYKSVDAIFSYTEDSFLFQLMDKAFRSEDFENIFSFRRYIFDLHQGLEKLVKKPETTYKKLQLYQGTKLHTTALQQLKDNIRGLISINGFLSTTYNLEIAQKIFSSLGHNLPDDENVLFKFYIDETTMIKTYAKISSISQYPLEEEVLFSIGSIWMIDSVQMNDDLCWTVELSSCNDVDLKIVQFFEELSDDSTLIMIGDLLLELGQHTQAENFYSKMLDESTVNDQIRFTLYNKIAKINIDQGNYHAAQQHFSKAEKLISTRVINMELETLQPLYSNHIATTPIYILNNMGLSYQKTGDSDNALECFMRALETQGGIEPKYKATVYHNIGLIFFNRQQYDKALKHFSEAVVLARDHSSLSEYKQHQKAAEERLRSTNTSVGEQLH